MGSVEPGKSTKGAPMSPTVEILTEEDLQARRAEILAAQTLTEEELRRGAARYTLTADEVAALDEVDRIDYLLGG